MRWCGGLAPRRPSEKLLLSLAGLLACGVVLPTASFAGESVRYASPDGAGDACTQQSPCELFEALSASNAGNDIRLLGGEYDVGSRKLILSSGIRLYAADRFDPVTLSVDNGGSYSVRVTDGAELRDVSIRSSGENAALEVNGKASAVSRVSVESTAENATACLMTDGRMSDSLCSSRGSNANALVGLGDGEGTSITLRNVTAYAQQRRGILLQSDADTPLDLDARNVIAAGGSADVNASGAQVDADFASSNYFVVSESVEGSVTRPGSGSNQTDEPIFVDSANGNLRPAQGSPTIDAGNGAAADLGESDLGGADRVQGDSVDIGAYEFDSEPPEIRITRSPAKKTRSRTATFRFTVRDDSGTTAFLPGCKLDRQSANPCDGSVTYRGVKPGRHVFTVTALDEAGNRGTATYVWKIVTRRKRRE